MKKFMYLGAAALAGLFATSCASDEPVAGTTDGMTTFTVQMPEDLTRAFGEGTSAQTLCVAIYESGKQEAPLFTNFGGNENLNGMDIKPGDALNWTVSVPLVKGRTYDIVCWAQSYANTATTPYEFNPTARTITVKYDQMANYAEARDAFFGNLTYTSTGKGDDIKLYRPFAQINVLTSDYQAFKYGNGTASAATDPNTFGISVTGLSNTLNIFDGTISSTLEENTVVTAGLAPVKDGKTIGTDDDAVIYNYLAMAYVLAGTDATHGESAGTNVNVTLNTNEKEGFATYDNVPVRPNYRTNIYGALLTNPEVFNVVIENGFETPDINNPIPVATEEDFKAAIAAGKTPVLTQDLVVATIPNDANGNASVELNNNTLTVKETSYTSGNVNIKNGTLASESKYLPALVALDNGGTVNLDNVKINNNNQKVGSVAAFTPDVTWTNPGAITISNSNLEAVGVVVGTNASFAKKLWEANLPYTITINNTTIKGITGVYLNVPCKLVMNNCKVTGTAQALVVRGGTAELNDCEFTTTFGVNYDFNKFNWKSGTYVPIAAMTVGEISAETYNFVNNVTATRCTFTVINPDNKKIGQNGDQDVPCVYVSKAVKDVNVTLNNCKFVGGEPFYNNNNANVTVN